MFVMLNKFRGHIKHLGIYLLASLIPMVISVLLNPLIALNMSPSDYAIVGYYTAFNTLLAPIITFYLTHYYTKKYFEYEDDRRRALKSTIFKTLISLSFGVTLVLFFGLYGYSAIFNHNSEIPFMPYALIAVFTLPLIGIYSLTLVEFRMQRKSKSFFILSVSNGLLSSLMIVLLVVLLKFGATGKLIATFSGSLIIFIVCLVLNKDLFRYKFDRTIFKESVIFCAPLVIADILSFFSGGYDKVLLERGGNLTTLGIYVVGVSIASYLNVFTNSINDTFQPDVFQSIVKKNYRKCAKIIFVKIALITVVVAAFILAAPFLIRLLTAGRYVASTPYAMIVSLSCITSMLYYSFSQVTIARGYTTVTLLSKILGSILCVFLYQILISRFGAIGAAWGIVLSFAIFFIGNLFLFIIKEKLNSKNAWI